MQNNEQKYKLEYVIKQIRRMLSGDTPVMVTGASYLGNIFGVLINKIEQLKEDIKELKK